MRFTRFVPVVIALVLLVAYQDCIWIFIRYHSDAYVAIAKHKLSNCLQSSPTHSTETYPNANWTELLIRQERNHTDRWVVYRPSVDLGMCNRILNSLSMLLFAMATNRTLWVEWEAHDMEYITANEFAGATSYDELFVSKLHRNRPSTSIISTPVDEPACFIENLRFSSDLNRVFPQQVVNIHRGDWVGGVLMKNQAYANTVFKGLNAVEGFPILFRSMFTLHPPQVQPERCNWLIQYRQIWPPPYATAPFESFLRCAFAHGMTEADYNTTWVMTDDPVSMFAEASPATKAVLSRMNHPSQSHTCRGPCGDRQAMETMYRMSQCRSAVLTQSSSFGSCITSLAQVSKKLMVGRYGDCLLGNPQPTDANHRGSYGGLPTYLTDIE